MELTSPGAQKFPGPEGWPTALSPLPLSNPLAFRQCLETLFCMWFRGPSVELTKQRKCQRRVTEELAPHCGSISPGPRPAASRFTASGGGRPGRARRLSRCLAPWELDGSAPFEATGNSVPRPRIAERMKLWVPRACPG